MTPVGTEGTNTVAASDRADGRRTPSAVLIPERLAGTKVRGSKHQRQQEDLDETKYNEFFSSPLRHSQPAVLDVSSYSTRFPSTRVRIPGVLEEDNIEHQLTIDSATDIPCISKTFIDKHEKLRQKCIFPIPPGAISLRSADGSPLQILGYIRFTLKLGTKSLPVEALVLPHLGPDIMLLDNSITKSFGAKLDWLTECLSFQDSLETIPARHVKSPLQSEYCSIITQTVNTLPTPVLVSRKVVIPAAHEALIRVFSTARPEKDTLALIEPRIALIHTLDDMPQDDIWQSVIIARTVTQWSKVTNSALLQVGNPSDRNIILKPNTIVGTITPVTAISPRTASAVTQNCSESSQARIDLTAALDESFKNTTFDDQQRAQIINLCTEYRSVFSLNQKELGKCTIAEAEFPLQKDTKPVDRHPYRTNPRAQEVIDKCVDDMEEIDIIEKRPSEWGSPVCIVAKADGSPRFCVDYRATINRFLVRETWPMPDIESHTDTVGGANFITVCDVQSAYWQIPIAPKDRHKTAFVTSKGKYVFKVLPFGIANAPWIFQRVMSLAFANFGQPSGLLVYMDDLIACSATWEAHLKLLEDMFRALQTAGLTLKPAKIHFGPKEVQYLGHVLSADGIRMGEDRIKAIVDLKTPTTIKELLSVLGTVNFVRKFIPNLATKIEPLVALTRKSVANLKTLRNIWGPEQDAAFIKVKELLTSAPVLHFPRFHKPFIIHVDASDCGVGAFLAQKDDNGELAIIAYFSKRFTSSQQHYSATQKECLAVVLAVTHWRPYIWGAILFVLRIIALSVICIPCKIHLICLHGGLSRSNRMILRWSTNQGN